MKRFRPRAFTRLFTGNRRSRRRDGCHAANTHLHVTTRRATVRRQPYSLILLVLLCCVLSIGINITLATAQTDAPPDNGTIRETTIEQRKEGSQSLIPLPNPPEAPPEVTAPPAGQYVLEFNRSPIVGSRLSLRGIYDEARLGFTRPRDWQVTSVKALIRYRHSPALYATRSNLTVLINGVSVGSIPLNQQEGEIGQQVFEVPVEQLRNYNELVIGALQNNSPTCTQDPYDPSLWTEILPDSQITFEFEPQPVTLNFTNYPYPVFDELSLEPNRVAYLLPQQLDQSWLTTTTRFQAALGRLADYRRLEARLVETIDDIDIDTTNPVANERLIIIGTPENQPELASLTLPLAITDNQLLDNEQNPIPPEVGVLMLTTTPDQLAPVFVATGNSPEGVAKAVQFLVQPQDSQIGTGQVIIVDTLTEVPSPPPRDWPGFLPTAESFKLSDLSDRFNQPFEDTTVRGSDSPPIEFDFRGLPDDQFQPGSSMTLVYSYGPQINPKTSIVEVKLDDVALIGKGLTSVDGATRNSFKVQLPHDKITPTSKIQVDFRLDARERRSCSKVTDQQLWGTLHADTSFDLNRVNSVELPNLQLLQYGFPFAAPQDLSTLAIVLPKEPSNSDVMTALEFSTRLGRLSQAESIQLETYTADSLPTELRDEHNLVGIGTLEEFPLPEALKLGDFQLGKSLSRQWDGSKIQASPDYEGVIKEVISPWNSNRVVLALSAHNQQGLEQVQDFLHTDSLFFQLRGDTVLISANDTTTEASNTNQYNLEFLQREQQRQIPTKSMPEQILKFFIDNWFMLAPAMVAAALILYGIIQLYLKRIAVEND